MDLWHHITHPLDRPKPENYSWLERMAWLGVIVVVYLVGWFGIQAWVTRQGRFYDLSTPLDRAIPLVPTFSWAYAMIYALIAAAVLFIRNRELYLIGIKGVLGQTAVAYAVFLLLPVRMDYRPDVDVHLMEGWSAMMLSFYYAIDQPLNLFPSMHLALGVWCGFALVADRPTWKWPVYFSIFWISLSVVFVRQHYIADAMAGLAMALATRRMLLNAPAPLPQDADNLAEYS